MIIYETSSLFPWDALEDSPSIKVIRQFIQAIPDSRLLDALDQHRGNGRDDYPVRVLWGTTLLNVALRHPNMQATLDELTRNSDLRRLLEIENEELVPKKWNMTRFLDTLGMSPHRQLLEEIFNHMVAMLGEVVDDFGRNTAGDATALSVRAKKGRGHFDEILDELPQPSGGRKEYLDDEGRVTKAYEWFGMKLHLLVDTKHEVAISYTITPPSSGDGETLPDLLDKSETNLPPKRIKTVSYDKAADTNPVHKDLEARKIKPVVEVRELWKDDHERMLPGHDGNSNVVYDEAGTLFCYDCESQPLVKHQMAYMGHEASRGTLKYRCPARHEGWPCPSDGKCNGTSKYGKTVRVRREIDLRRFPPIPRATQQFEKLYKGRTSVERVNARLKIFWGVDDGNVTGSARFHGRVGVVMVTHITFALLLAMSPRRPIKKGRSETLGGTRLSPVAEALRSRIADS